MEVKLELDENGMINSLEFVKKQIAMSEKGLRNASISKSKRPFYDIVGKIHDNNARRRFEFSLEFLDVMYQFYSTFNEKFPLKEIIVDWSRMAREQFEYFNAERATCPFYRPRYFFFVNHMLGVFDWGGALLRVIAKENDIVLSKEELEGAEQK